MDAITGGTLEAGIMLSGTDRQLADMARPTAAHAQPLLAASRACLVSLTIASQRRTAPVTMCWTGAAQPVPLRSILPLDDAVVRRALAGFELAGKRLLVALVRRWPANAIPPAIGIVTDGGGVVFSPDHPSPLSADWLALHEAGRCTPMTLLAFTEAGAWRRMTGIVENRRIH